MAHESQWAAPLLWYLATRGGCLARGMLAALLSVDATVVRRMVWGLRRRGYAVIESGRVCISRRGLEAVRRFRAMAKKRNKFVMVGDGLLVYITVKASGAKAYTFPLRSACLACDVLAASPGTGYKEIARKTGLAAKTASYILKALNVAGCPGPGCMLECCNASSRSGKS